MRAWRSRNSTPQANVVHISESGRARGIVAIPTTGSETTAAPASADSACGAPSSRATAKTAIAVVTRKNVIGRRTRKSLCHGSTVLSSTTSPLFG